jgi:hypothetical protein
MSKVHGVQGVQVVKVEEVKYRKWIEQNLVFKSGGAQARVTLEHSVSQVLVITGTGDCGKPIH